ncbi:hypothetical protein CMI46_02445 [Candidatus Pacearchaeota archaeon]|nr:hypothetical protein [Candidatus Pacearchaeota archaeon]|tara:strand:+ start:823 stop:1077 length:255 start_codon:yes stop_codon:yes gene_type:complete
MEDDRGVIIEGIVRSYQDLSKVDPGNDLLKYITLNGLGFDYSSRVDVREEFVDRFSLPMDRSDVEILRNYSDELNQAVGEVGSG